MNFKDKSIKKSNKYNPEVPITNLESVFKETKEKNKDELLKELDDNILMYKELIQEYNLTPKIHVNQFTSIGGIEACVEAGALSVDHLEVLTDEDINWLKNLTNIHKD